MRILLASLQAAILIGMLAVDGRTQGQSGGSAPSSNTPTSNTPSPGRTTRTPSRQPEQSRGPVFVTGQVVSDLGRPIQEPVSAQLICGMRAVQAVHADLGGYFTFNLGGGFQSNFDFSASNESPELSASGRSALPTRYGDNALAGCELRISVAGYYPLNRTISEHADMGRVDLGVLRLSRIGGMQGSNVSVSALMVPKDASKEFDKAVKDIQSSKQDSAVKHLEKAVEIYDQYAAAWNELGRIYLSRGLKEKAIPAFEKAAAADPHFVAPLLNLATIQIQDREWEKGAGTAQRALDIDGSVSFASFLVAVGNFNMSNLEVAERNAQEAQKDAGSNLPQVHALLAQIYLQKQDYPQALTHMRSYLAESPDGHYAEQIKKDIADIEQWVAEEHPAAVEPAPAVESQ
jgi:tetratricopeptide (TPR) repeat protein